MGNIADALKKAGVELPDHAPVEVRRDDEVVAAEEPSSYQESTYTVTNKRAPAVDASQPLQSGPWNERIQMVLDSVGPVAESFKVLRSKILFPKDGKARPRTIMISSSSPEEGKSFVSINLAVAIARGLDQHALLVDCDLRRPSLLGLLGMGAEYTRGLAEYLQGDSELAELICRTSVDKLSLLPSGTPPQNPAELLTSVRMSRLVNELSGRYSDRFIIFDSAPFQIASETMVLAKNVDGVVLVIGSGKSDKARLRRMVENIGPDKILGIVFNGHKQGYFKKKMFDPYGSYYGKYYSSNARK
ncbi:polysaccharide biosynthesis tyrosine autokinase [Desulfopila aestuarii]|uniref:Exopolysaccharide/PEP-CTERM locus tyrosine autokinase n=1 Tax=Desulfopila aestuarii DSM 18488 TaxID=1121416 RepID=A0A1M7Y300_9BACT|nr:polysaccharide biosynthesis tyrosine autokinase [Desulfopila aestuarii]SHO46139.1 exopolysaccharide/PEP-CTERM locus tyrosine autokinase [Desulfopila aestuarii DSM 18488]